MNILNETIAKREKLSQEIDKLNEKIKEMTDLPDEWEVDPGHHELMAGGVALHGHCCASEREDESVSISISNGGQYGAVFYIRDNHRGTCSPWIDPEAVRAGLRIYDMIEKEKKEKRLERKDRA